MKKFTPFFGIAVFLIAGFAFGAVGDSICTMQSKPGTCIDDLDGDTIYVPNDVTLFGKEVGFCPQQVPIEDSIQLIICLDQSGSMQGNDPSRDAIRAAQGLIDSIAKESPASMVGVVLFPCVGCSAAGLEGSATGFFPLKMTPANANTMKFYTQSGYSYIGYGTPYGAALDTALSYFNRLPAMPSSKRYVIFLSDGEPNGATYTAFLNAGKAAQLPATHTIYYHTSGTSWTAQSTLLDLATRTGGTAYNATSAATMYSAFNSILNTIIRLKHFTMLNTATGQGSLTSSTLSGAGQQIRVYFDPLDLSVGPNPIRFYYRTQGDASYDILRTVTIFRRPGTITPQQQAVLDNSFNELCFERSSITFNNAAYSPIPAGTVYDASFNRAYVGGRRGFGTSAIQNDTVLVRSRGGDEERVVITETGSVTNTYNGFVPLSISATRTKFNNILEVLTVDTLYLTYSNRDFYSGGLFFDKSYDTIAVSLSSGIADLPQTSGTHGFALLAQPSAQGVAFQVSLDKPGSYGVSVYDLQGRTVWSHKGNAMTLGTNSLSWNWASKGAAPRNGIYFAVLKSGNAQLRRELVLVR